MKIRLAQAVLSLALASAALPAATFPASAEDKVVATVNGQPVTESDLAIADSEIGADMGTMPETQKRMSLLEFLIDNQLFAEAADADKLGQGAEFENRLKYLKRRALRELYFESDADARKIYDEQVAKIKPEEEVSARHILVESEEKAKELKEKIKAGGDFAALAKEHTKDTGSKEDGGNLGYFSHGQMVPQFEEVVFKLNKGDVSDPVKTQFGYHLVMTTKKTPAVEAKDGKSAAPEKVQASHILVKAQSAQKVPSKADMIDHMKKNDERNFMQKFIMDLIKLAKIEASEEFKQFLPAKDEPPKADPKPAKKAESAKKAEPAKEASSAKKAEPQKKVDAKPVEKQAAK